MQITFYGGLFNHHAPETKDSGVERFALLTLVHPSVLICRLHSSPNSLGFQYRNEAEGQIPHQRGHCVLEVGFRYHH
jgi:hypothetical protein